MKRQLISIYMVILIMIISGCQKPQNVKPEPDISETVSYTSAKVSYLGPEGTYTQEACDLFFEHQGSLMPYTTVNDAVNALVDKETDYAVIPQENTIGGAVVDYIDTLIGATNVSVVGEVELLNQGQRDESNSQEGYYLPDCCNTYA